MPKRARTGCRPHHTLLVMNSALHAYFRRATLGHNFRSGTPPPGVRPRPETQPWRPYCGFHHFSYGWNVPCTAVDSTFQVLLCSGRNCTFCQTAQTPELLGSPF